jgi:hypothetical protein
VSTITRDPSKWRASLKRRRRRATRSQSNGFVCTARSGPKSPVATQTRSKTKGRIAMTSMYRQTSVISGQRPSTTARRKMTSIVKATEQMSSSSTRVWPGRRRGV